MNIHIEGRAAARAVTELLSPWRILFTTKDEADVTLVYGEKAPDDGKRIVIPSHSPSFNALMRDRKLGVETKPGELMSIPVTRETVLKIRPKEVYSYSKLPHLTTATAEAAEDLVLFNLDVVTEYARILNETLNPKPSIRYRVLTGLPIPYGLAPRRVRDLIMKNGNGHENPVFYNRLSMDAFRFALANAIERLTRKKIPRRTWNGRAAVCLCTHDVDTGEGLRHARRLKKLEEKYDVPSAWYLPSKRYRLDAEIIKDLVNHGEIGTHDTKHDGKLAQLPKTKLIKRLVESKASLEKIANCSVKGFRAPLLQHTARILQSLHQTGYSYDTSTPTWEPTHPYTMKSHGISTTFPLTLEGITEVPVTLPQDHQLLHVLGANPKEVVGMWMSMVNAIKEIGGLCSVLVHPEYELARLQNLGMYEEFLNMVASDKQMLTSLPTDIAAFMK